MDFFGSPVITKIIRNEYNGPWLFRWFRMLRGSYITVEQMRELLSSIVEDALLATYSNSHGMKLSMGNSKVRHHHLPVWYAYEAAFIELPQRVPVGVVEALVASVGDKYLFIRALQERMPRGVSKSHAERIATELWTALLSESTIFCIDDGCVLGAEGKIIFFKIPLTEARRIALLEAFT